LKRIFIRLLKFLFNIELRGFWIILTYGTLFTIFLSFLNVIYPEILRKFIDLIIKNEKLDLTLFKFVFLLIILKIFITGGNLVFTYYIQKFKNSVTQKIQVFLYSKILNIPLIKYSQIPLSDYVTRILYDSQNIVQLFPEFFFSLFKEILIIIGGLIILLNYHGVFVLFFVLYLILQSYISIKGGQIIENINSMLRKEISIRLQKIINPLHNILIVKAYNIKNKIIEIFNKILHRFFDLQLNSYFKKNFYTSLSSLISSFMTIGVIIFSVFLYRNNTISVGGIMAIIYILNMISTSLNTITSFYLRYNSILPSSKKLIEILDLEEEKEGKIEGLNNFNIKFTNVNFSYNGVKKVLDGVTFEIREGEWVALVGKSGEGKSTIIKLLLGLYDNYEGEIKIGDVEIRNLKKSFLRNLITFIPQEDYLFPGTIRENLTIVKEVPDEILWKVLEWVNLKEYVMSLSKKLDTDIREAKLFLSGGERQRLSIARGFLKDSKIIIFDESMSQIDSLSEKIIFNAFKKLAMGKTAIVIAHRISTVARLNKILVLENGKISSSGTHKELMSKNRLYKELCELQMIK